MPDMHITIPEHGLELMAQEWGERLRARNEAAREARRTGDPAKWREVAKADAWMEGVHFAFHYLGVRRWGRFLDLARTRHAPAATQEGAAPMNPPWHCPFCGSMIYHGDVHSCEAERLASEPGA